MKKIYSLFVINIVLLLLASTNFSIIMFLGENTSFSWNYYTYAFRNGFGYEYVSDYSLAQVLTYIAAYSAGLISFAYLYFRSSKLLSFLGFILSLLGLISFIIEGSHWVVDHHQSWIVSFPIGLIVLWILVVIRSVNREHSAECPVNG